MIDSTLIRKDGHGNYVDIKVRTFGNNASGAASSLVKKGYEIERGYGDLHKYFKPDGSFAILVLHRSEWIVIEYRKK
jgi:hypothetical protein